MNQSLICPIRGEARDVERALNETERFAHEESLSGKQALHLRLLAEELLGMTGSVLDVRDGQYWIERRAGECELHLNVRAQAGETARSILIDLSTDRKNAAYAGVKGHILKALDAMSASPVYASVPTLPGEDVSASHPAYIEWAYQSYLDSLDQDQKAAAWDEMEKSVLGKLARDIVVGVRPDSVSIVLKAKNEARG